MKQTFLSPMMLVLVLMFSKMMCSQETEQHLQNESSDHEHGIVELSISCNEEAQAEFETGLAHLHHMMYEQARPHFEAATEADSECAMAHWGIAMTSFYPLWMPTPDALLERGQEAVKTAREIGAPTEREEAYIAAVEAFFTNPEPPQESRAKDHEARVKAWKKAQRELHENHPDDVDGAAFYALAEVCYAQTQFSPDEERDYSRQREAGALLERFWEDHPQHPGLFHYIIHAYDSPELAEKAVEAAEGYDQIAPDTPHALHMPSHIFVRLGHWEETIDWNIRSAEAALRQADHDSHAKLHYVHALDYKMYGYLQVGDEENARETLDKVMAVETLPDDMISGYGVAAAIARYHLEQQKWEEAAQLEIGTPDVISWEEYPENMALYHYARGLGAARTGDLELAETEREHIRQAVNDLHDAGNSYWAYMSEALGKAVEAWTLYERGETDQALNLMSEAADLEDSMDKHPVSPGEVLPVRELYGELLLKEGREEEAVTAFEASLERTPNRLNALNNLEKLSDIAVGER